MIAKVLTAALGFFSLAACATIPPAADAPPVPAEASAPESGHAAGPETAAEAARWAFEGSDLKLDAAWRYGTLPNGMRYLIRRNATPPGQAMVQMYIGSGSLAESEQERGLAHFIEHMAFNGSSNVPEGEMIKLLEREGLAFGADTNASTGFDATIYKLDLPRAEEELLDTALFLMRETASELLFDPEAVEREKGVLLSERRARNTYQLRNIENRLQFFYPASHFAQRLPIGTIATIEGATADGLRAMWQRLYRPTNTVLVVVGDFDPDMVESKIADQFDDWQAAGDVTPPSPGPFDFDRPGETQVYVDPALSERVTIARTGPWIDRPDTAENRRIGLLQRIGYGIVNRRLQSLSRSEDPPFADAGFGTSDVFEEARTTNLIVDTAVGGWQRGLAAAQAEYRRALQFGFTEAEVAEQLANIRTGLENAAAGAQTFGNGYHVQQGLALVRRGSIPTTPESNLARFEAMVDTITPEAVLEALRADAIALGDPQIRFEGRTGPKGGEAALRESWDAGMQVELAPLENTGATEFAYTDFGTPGTVVEDRTDEALGIRMIRFENGVMLNIKRTDLQEDRVMVQVNIDGGQMLNTRENPLATAMVRVLPLGGLGQHPIDELQSVLAGRSVGLNFSAQEETFRFSATTTPRDLQLQLQVLTAALTDPGYRREGEIVYERQIRDFFAARNATPNAALGNSLGGIISDDDPRFTVQPMDDYLALDFAKLRSDMSERFQNGAIEIAIVGDVDEALAIDYIARTFGALPQREASFGEYAGRRDRGFTADRSARTVLHEGPADQAILRMSWPATDDSDLEEALTLEMLGRVMRLRLTDVLREELGQTYSPGVNVSLSRTYTGYGTFNIAASVDVAQVDPAREAMLATVSDFIARPPAMDLLERARAPLLETYRNLLSSNAGWMALVDRAQTEPERIARFARAREVVMAVTPADLQAAAAKYLQPGERLEITVLPRSVVEPEGAAE
ncbi:M16 family metallopeptidase [Paraurantiacibacter namhicola]|uniref:Peptidase M16 inactive domain protein n=1 Tax=Paraurantiacibacter namhicola TaxID=645517 RepID=A0A1C7DA48_9SPHN|nr:insulinase family protein [Paraurantiacibacter namhicola]ANU08369.1 Peptidase M16 inactive domain protein [Paraurantiacibacter namhicola]